MCFACNSRGRHEALYYSQDNRSSFEGYPTGCCSVEKGYYCIWDRKMIALSCEDWVELCDLRNVLRQISHITFNVVAERQRARSALNNLSRAAPFGEAQRFPWGKIYVNISCSVYADLFQKLLGALDFKDRETEKELRYGNNHKQDDKDQTSRHDSALDDSKTQYRFTLTNIHNELCKLNEAFDRVSFEVAHNLRWCVGNIPGPPNDPTFPPRDPPSDRFFYRDFMNLMKDRGLDPADFRVFNENDMKEIEFKCGKETQVLGPSLSDRPIPDNVKYVYIFSNGEYVQCDEKDSVKGYIFSVKTGNLSSELNLKSPRSVYRTMEDMGYGLDDSDYRVFAKLFSMGFGNIEFGNDGRTRVSRADSNWRRSSVLENIEYGDGRRVRVSRTDLDSGRSSSSERAEIPPRRLVNVSVLQSEIERVNVENGSTFENVSEVEI